MRNRFNGRVSGLIIETKRNLIFQLRRLKVMEENIRFVLMIF